MEQVRRYIYQSYQQAISAETEEFFSSLEKRKDVMLRSGRMESILKGQANKASQGITK